MAILTLNHIFSMITDILNEMCYVHNNPQHTQNWQTQGSDLRQQHAVLSPAFCIDRPVLNEHFLLFPALEHHSMLTNHAFPFFPPPQYLSHIKD